MDMNYNHNFLAGSPGTPTFGGTGNPNDRIAFLRPSRRQTSTSGTPSSFGQIGTIVVRDPITGPLRVARKPREYAPVAVSASPPTGVVMIELPVITNPKPVANRCGDRPLPIK